MNYEESKKALDKIRSKDEVMFRMAISHLIDVGIRHLSDDNVEVTCAEIMKEDDTKSFMTNKYKCDLVRMAAEIAKIDHIHLLVYIQQEVEYDVRQEKIGYHRSVELLRRCMDWMSEYGTYETPILRDAFLDSCGFSEEEVEQLGFGYVFPENRCEEEEE